MSRRIKFVWSLSPIDQIGKIRDIRKHEFPFFPPEDNTEEQKLQLTQKARN